MITLNEAGCRDVAFFISTLVLPKLQLIGVSEFSYTAESGTTFNFDGNGGKATSRTFGNVAYSGAITLTAETISQIKESFLIPTIGRGSLIAISEVYPLTLQASFINGKNRGVSHILRDFTFLQDGLTYSSTDASSIKQSLNFICADVKEL